MQEHPRVVTHLPLDTLWDQNGRETPAVKQRALTGQDIKDLLRAGGVRFVVADGGYPLRWIAHHEVFTFWKHEVQPHLYDETRLYLADYPNEYFYWPSEWRSHSGETIILLERAH